MKKLLSFTFIFAVGAICAAELALAKNGKTAYRIVASETTRKVEPFLLSDLRNLLKSATNVDFPIKGAAEQPRDYRIFVGIPPKGFPMDSLHNQEHCVMTCGNDLYLFGKGLSGTRYAVYDFLENVLGFRFYDARGGMRVPKTAVLKIPELNRKKQFDFEFRSTTGYWLFNHPESPRFFYRNGINYLVSYNMLRDGDHVEKDEFRPLFPFGHSLSLYLPKDSKYNPCPWDKTFAWIRALNQNLWKDHPEYFTLAENGKRVDYRQRCLSNPEVRKLLAERILENMRRNPDCNVFDVSANDAAGRFCNCANCIALEKKYECYGGPLFDFVLEFCPIAAKKYPGKKISILVYRKGQTQPPPKNIKKFPDNFSVLFAPIDDNFAKDWNHPDNRQSYEDLKEWCRLCSHVNVWYYPNIYPGRISLPLGNVARLANDIVLMKKAGVKGMIWEHNVGVPEMIGFTELQSYVAMKLFQDSSRPWKKLADEFIEFEYGKAAPLMHKYLNELHEINEKTETFLPWNAQLVLFSYLTPERMIRWNGYFDKMEKLLKDDPEKLFNVQRVRINLDYAMLKFYPKIKAERPDFSVTPETLDTRIRETYKRACDTLFHKRFVSRKKQFSTLVNDAALLAKLRSGGSKELPAEIFGKYNPASIYQTIPTVYRNNMKTDPDAAWGVCAVHDNPETGLPFYSYFIDFVSKKYHGWRQKITKAQLGKRGAYQFYNMGKIKLTPNCEFQMGACHKYSHLQFKANVGSAYEMGTVGNAIVYASLKFEGPIFYKEDAGKKNVVYCDRVVVIRMPD